MRQKLFLSGDQVKVSEGGEEYYAYFLSANSTGDEAFILTARNNSNFSIEQVKLDNLKLLPPNEANWSFYPNFYLPAGLAKTEQQTLTPGDIVLFSEFSFPRRWGVVVGKRDGELRHDSRNAQTANCELIYLFLLPTTNFRRCCLTTVERANNLLNARTALQQYSNFYLTWIEKSSLKVLYRISIA